MAKEKGLSTARENLEQFASESIRKHGNEFLMKRVIERIQEKGFLEQDRKEEETFHIKQATSMADYSLDNSGRLEDLHHDPLLQDA